MTTIAFIAAAILGAATISFIITKTIYGLHQPYSGVEGENDPDLVEE